MAAYSPITATTNGSVTAGNFVYPVNLLSAENADAFITNGNATSNVQRSPHVPPPANSIVLTIRMLMSGKVS